MTDNMSELRERARVWVENMKLTSELGQNSHRVKTSVNLIADLLAALSTVEKDTRELCISVMYKTMGHLASPLAPYNRGVSDTLADVEAAIRREGENG